MGNRFDAKVSTLRTERQGRGREEEKRTMREVGRGSHQKTPAGLINPTSDCVHILKCWAD